MNEDDKTLLGQGLIKSLEWIADDLKARRAEREKDKARLTARTARLDLKPRAYSADDLKAVRANLGASQALLAEFLGVSPNSLRKWEHEDRGVPPYIARHLDDIVAFPEIWTRRVQAAPKVRKAAPRRSKATKTGE